MCDRPSMRVRELEQANEGHERHGRKSLSQQENALQQGVHEHKSSPEARPVGRAVKSITCSGRDEWLFASLCRAKQAIRNRQKGKYVSFKVIRHSEVSDAVRHVRPYSILD